MITRVYGKADNFELEFSWDGSVWNAAVPADLTDGKYVCEFWAVDSYGYTAYYTGILYMFDGKATLEIEKDDIVFEICPDEIVVSPGELDWCRMGINFILGEEKNLPFRVRSLTGQSLVITNAVFKLMSNGRAIQEGKCDIDGQMLYCFLKPSERGCMYIEIEYSIAPEIRKTRFNVNVV